MIELLQNCQVVVPRYIAGRQPQPGLQAALFKLRGEPLCTYFHGVPVRDMTSGFVAYQSSVLRGLNVDAIRSEGHAFLVEMKCLLRSARHAVLRVSHRARARRFEIQQQNHHARRKVSAEGHVATDIRR
jgi:hypothetical protein